MTDTSIKMLSYWVRFSKGCISKGFDTVYLNEDEVRVQHFHGELDRRLMGST